MFDIAWSELALIAVVALVVIGPKDLPKVMRNAGRWSRKLRAMASEFQRHIDDMVRESELDDLKKEAEKAADFNSIGIEIDKAVDAAGIKDAMNLDEASAAAGVGAAASVADAAATATAIEAGAVAEGAVSPISLPDEAGAAPEPVGAAAAEAIAPATEVPAPAPEASVSAPELAPSTAAPVPTAATEVKS